MTPQKYKYLLQILHKEFELNKSMLAHIYNCSIMKDKRFTLIYNEGEERKPSPSDEGFDTVQEAKEWCDKNSIPYEAFSITEWDLNSIDACGVPDIIAVVNFGGVIMDGAEDLGRYSTY